MKAVPLVVSLYSKSFYLLLVTVVAGVLQGCSSAETERGFPFKRGESGISDFTSRGLQSTILSSLTGNISPSDHKCTIPQRLEEGFKRAGHYTRTNKMQDAASCATMCRLANDNCKGINYDSSTKMCYFLDRLGYIYRSSGYTTALVRPAAADLCNSDNFALDTNNLPGIMRGSPFTLGSAKECCYKCSKTPGCIGFNYISAVKRCWLKNNVSQRRVYHGCVMGLMCP